MVNGVVTRDSEILMEESEDPVRTPKKRWVGNYQCSVSILNDNFGEYKRTDQR